MVVLALDVGGTKLAAALVGDDGVVRRSARRRTPDPAGPAVTGAVAGAVAGAPVGDPWDAVVEMLREVAGADPVDGVGVGCGGPMRWPAGVVSPLNMPAWRDFPLRERLAECWPGVPVRVHNDAPCLAVGEHVRRREDLLGMVVSTGVGGGLVLGGRLLDGPTGNAGHIGHLVVEPDGPPCGCGGRGCLEAVARGPAVVAWARERGSAALDGVQLAQAARAGDPLALQAFGRAGDALGRAIASAVALLDVRLVVIGGGLAATGAPLWDPLRASLARHARLAFLTGLRVEPAAADAGLVGAAALVLGGDRYWSAG